MASLTIGDAKKADADALLALEAASFDSDRLSPRSFRHLLASSAAAVRVARLDGRTAGYHLLLFRAGTRVARLYSIAVDPRYRGAGVAKALLRDVERTARKRGSSVVRLEVREDNLPAIRLYQQLGYRVIGRYKNYYADGAGALRYEKSLGGRSDRTADEDRSPEAGRIFPLNVALQRPIPATHVSPLKGPSLHLRADAVSLA